MSKRPCTVDLRAHYAAPSTKNDDLRYQTQALAYLSFASTQRIELNDDMAFDGQQRSQNKQLSPMNARKTTPRYINETQAAVLFLHSQLDSPTYRSSPVITASKQNEGTESIARSGRQSRLSSDAEDSISVTSSHLQTPVFERSRKRRRTDVQGGFSTTAKPVHQSDSRSSSSMADEALSRHHPQERMETMQVMATGKRRHAASAPLERPHVSEETTSELPTTYSLSDLSSERSKMASTSIQRSLSDPGQPTVAQPARERIRQEQYFEQTSDQRDEPESHVDSSTQSEAIEAHARHDHSNGSANALFMRQIFAPPAQIGIGSFDTHVTDRLRYLADSSRLRGICDTLQPSRTLDALERGHWYFSIASWSQPLQHNFWSFLEEFISTGAAGWGVWCTWSAFVTSKQKDIVKAFCWGEIVKHTYLLLYVASRSHIRHLGLQWIDAAGEVVIRIGK